MVRIAAGDLHVNIDGVIGQRIPEKGATNHETKILSIDISRGNLTNFGTLFAGDFLQLRAINLMLCSDSKHDTAQRGFDSFVGMKKDQGCISTDITSNPKTTSSFNNDRILRAVENIDCETFVSAVKEGIDPAVRVHGKKVNEELSRSKSKVLDQERREIIRGGLIMCQWRHGVIKSATVQCIFSEDIQDCSQLQANTLHLIVVGSVRIVKPWTFISNSVGGQIQGDLIFNDNAMLGTLNQLQVLGNVIISKTSTEIGRAHV